MRGYEHLTAGDVARMGRKGVRVGSKARSKYGAVKTTVDGVTFASKREAARYQELKMLEKAGQIEHLQLQPSFPLYVYRDKGAGIYIGAQAERVFVGSYIADFRYWDRTTAPPGEVVEDVKGVRTDIYKLKKKIVEACHGITIREVR